MRVDEKVISLQFFLEVFVCLFLHEMSRTLKRMSLLQLWMREIVKQTQCGFSWIVDAGRSFGPVFLFHISVCKRCCFLFTTGLVLHLEVNKKNLYCLINY